MGKPHRDMTPVRVSQEMVAMKSEQSNALPTSLLKLPVMEGDVQSELKSLRELIEHLLEISERRQPTCRGAEQIDIEALAKALAPLVCSNIMRSINGINQEFADASSVSSRGPSTARLRNLADHTARFANVVSMVEHECSSKQISSGSDSARSALFKQGPLRGSLVPQCDTLSA